jgi:sensor c-di-GMP phosphodiesterase-like protein
MGKNLKQRVIAEGIETQEQLALLQSWHCAEGQGYLFSRPVPAAQFVRLLQTGVSETVAQERVRHPQLLGNTYHPSQRGRSK